MFKLWTGKAFYSSEKIQNNFTSFKISYSCDSCFFSFTFFLVNCQVLKHILKINANKIFLCAMWLCTLWIFEDIFIFVLLLHLLSNKVLHYNMSISSRETTRMFSPKYWKCLKLWKNLKQKIAKCSNQCNVVQMWLNYLLVEFWWYHRLNPSAKF